MSKASCSPLDYLLRDIHLTDEELREPILMDGEPQKIMNYESLLSKYIKYVKEMEGVDFISNSVGRDNCDIKFSKEEWEELESISNKK